MLAIAVMGCGRIRFQSADASSGERPAASARHWVNRNDGAPGALLGPLLTYDDARGTVLLYGGQNTGGAVSAAMWELTANGWQQLCATCMPGARYGAGFAYYPDRDRVLLVGGYDGTSYHADMWQWDGTTWTQLTPAGAPPAGEFGHLVYDPSRKVMVLIGQAPGTVSNASIFEYDGTTWSNPAPTGGPSTARGWGNEASYDPNTGGIDVLTDNGSMASLFDELWSWNGATWTKICSGCSGRTRNAASIAFDPSLDLVWMFSGYAGGIQLPGSWQLVSNRWTQVDMYLPPERDSAGVAYDRARDVIVLYGGNGHSCNGGAGGNCAETWELVPN
jgi:hypothetical protein